MSLSVGALIGSAAGAAEYLLAFGLPDSDYQGSLRLAYLQVVIPYSVMGTALGALAFPLTLIVTRRERRLRRFITTLLICTTGGTILAYVFAAWVVSRNSIAEQVVGPFLGLALAVAIGGFLALIGRRAQPVLDRLGLHARYVPWLSLALLIVALALVVGLPLMLLHEDATNLPSSIRGEEGSTSKPNIVFILVDTLRADHLSFYGYSRETAPALAEIAETAVVFDQVSAPSSWTKPSVATIFTSMYPAVHKARGNTDYLPGSLTTIAEELKAGGYRTIGVTANPLVAPTFGFTQGFDSFSAPEVISPFRATVAGRLALKLYRGIREPQLPDRDAVHTRQESDPNQRTDNEPSHRVKGHALEGGRSLARAAIRKLAAVGFGERVGELPQGDVITEKALALVTEDDGSRPVFLYVHYIDPHLPYSPPSPYDHAFDYSVDRPVLASGREPSSLVESREDREWVERIVDQYDGEILYVDFQIKRLLSGLRSLGILENTVLVITSDHGEEFLERGHTGHGKTLFQELVQVPLIMNWPGRSASGTRYEGSIGLVDLLPTILELVGLEPSSNIQGVSLASRLQSTVEEAPDRPLYAEVQKSEMARFGQLKLIRDQASGTDELYDLGRDPHELEDLSDEETVLVLEMQRILENLRLATTELGEDVQSEVVDEEAEAMEALRALGYIE